MTAISVIIIFVLFLMAIFVAGFYVAMWYAKSEPEETFDQRYNYIKFCLSWSEINEVSFRNLIAMNEEASKMPDANIEKCTVLDIQIREKFKSLINEK